MTPLKSQEPDSLALAVADLLREAPVSSETERDDVKIIGALLAQSPRLVPTSTLAHATGWELARVNRPVRALDAAVRPTGLRVQRLRGGVALRPARSVADDRQLERLLRREMTRTKLSRSQLDMLAAVADGTVDEQRFTEADRLTYASLLNAELIVERDGTCQLADAVEYVVREPNDDPAGEALDRPTPAASEGARRKRSGLQPPDRRRDAG